MVGGSYSSLFPFHASLLFWLDNNAIVYRDYSQNLFFFFDEQATGVQGMNKCPCLGPDRLSRNEDPGTIV